MESAPADAALSQTLPDSSVSVASTSSPQAAASRADGALHLRLKTLDEHVFEVEAASSMSVAEFRAKVALATAVPASRQRLIYRGKLMKDGAELATYDLQDGHTVHLVAKSPSTPPPAVTNEEEVVARDPPLDGPAWNLANLRSALRRTTPTTETATQPLPMLREILDEMSESPQEAAESMGLDGRVANIGPRRQGPVMDLEPITQGILTMRTVLSTAAMEQEEGHNEQQHEQLEQQTEQQPTAVRRGPRQFFIGQWLDVKDTVNQWLESTVMDIAEGKVLVHYHGWPARWDEWIDFDSDRIAAFRTRTLHTQNTERMSPVPTTRVPSAPQVGDNDVRRMVVDVRRLMQEMMPHINRLADLCDDELRREQAQRQWPQTEGEASADALELNGSTTPGESRESEVSEVAHLVAPLFDRFGRLLMDSARSFDPLLRPELRGTAQRQQERRTMLLRRGSAPRQAASVSTSIEAQDNSLSLRDLITRSPDTRSESTQPRRSIDVHIHAIVAPASLASLASLNRGNSDTSNNQDENVSTHRVQTPSTPPIGRSFGLDDSRTIGDDGDHSRVPLLGAYRHRSHSQTSQQQQQRAVARDLDEFLSDDFFGTSFVHDNDDSDDDSGINDTHSEVVQSVYRPPSPSDRITSPRTPQSEGSSEYSSGTIGVIPEVAAAEERRRAQEQASNRRNEAGYNNNDNARASSVSAESSSSGFPTFLEVMRRTLSGVRNFVHSEASDSSQEGTSNPVEVVSGFSLPSSLSSSSIASSSSLSTPPISPVLQSSIGNSMDRTRSPSDSSIGEDLDLDEVD